MKPQWGVIADDRYRTVPESRLIDTLLVAGFPLEVQAGQRPQAEAQTATSLARWIELGLGYRRAENGERFFDPVEAVNCMKWAGLNGLDNFWADHFVRTGRAVLREWDDSNVPDLTTTAGPRPPRRFNVTVKRAFDLSQHSASAKARLRLPLPLEGWTNDKVKVSPIIPADLTANIAMSDGRFEAQFAAPANRAIEISAKLSFTTTGAPVDRAAEGLDEKDRELYLRSSEGLIKITSRIDELAKRLAGNGRNSTDVVTALWCYMLDELNCGMAHYDQVRPDAPGESVLDAGWYDCQLGASLFISMCRAQQIPARIVSGYVMYRSAPGFHYWAEVWLEDRGWTPFDVLCWDLSQKGRDKAWRDYFAGSVDYRMVTQCMPHAVIGPMSARFPEAWHLTTAPTATGMITSFHDLDGSLIYTDEVEVRKEPLETTSKDLSLQAI